jgi:hypothetical protein
MSNSPTLRPSAQHVTHRLSHHGVSQPSGLRASPHLAYFGSCSCSGWGVLRREEERRLLSLAHAVAGEAPVGCVPSRGSTEWMMKSMQVIETQ